MFRHRPGLPPNADALAKVVQRVFAANGMDVQCSSASEELTDAGLTEEVRTGGCVSRPSGEHARLFATAKGLVSPDQVAVFVVRRIFNADPASGCAKHPDDIPGLVITEAALAGTSTRTGLWVLAHEVAHVLGLEHTSSSRSLMFAPATAITASTPELSNDERKSVMASRRLGAGGFIPTPAATAAQLVEGMPRTTLSRSTPDRETPILESRHRTLLDDLD